MRKIILTLFILSMMFSNSYGKNNKWLTPYTNLKTDKQRIAMIEKIDKDETGTMTYEEQFKNILMLILDLRETDFTFIDHGGIFRSTKHWHLFMSRYIYYPSFITNKPYLHKWAKSQYGYKIQMLLEKLGYYGKEITTVKKKKIKAKHKKIIFSYAITLYKKLENKEFKEIVPYFENDIKDSTPKAEIETKKEINELLRKR